MNRIGIFCFYDKDGIVDEYIEFLLEELCSCLNSLIIVVNGKIDAKGKLIFKKYTDEVYIRENKGYDSGAYKDAIVNYIGWDKVQQYDELILCNDTFYGPLVSFESIFDEMRNESIDFWGLNYYYNKITNQIQSYFLVFRKSVLSENGIIKFFDENIDLSTTEIEDVYSGFELGLFQYLVNQGYSFASYTENNPYDLYRCSNIGIKEFAVPIIKKRAFSPECFIRDNIMDTLKYISKNSNYDLGLILNNIRRIYNLEITKHEIETFDIDKADIVRIRYNVAKVGSESIKNVVLKSKKLYVYGLGIVSRKISKIIDIYHGRIEGYIVSDDQHNVLKNKNGVKVYRISEVDNIDDVTIIVALGKKNTLEVEPYLKEFKKVIFLW